MTLEPAAVRQAHNRALARVVEAVEPVIRLVAERWVSRDPSPAQHWRRLAVFGASHIGDVLYRTPSLPALRRGLPNTEIVYVCAPQAAELLTSNPNIDDVLPLVDDADPHWRWRGGVRRALKAGGFDAALCTDHIAYHRDLLLVTAVGIPNRACLVHKGLTGLVTHPVRSTYPLPAPAYTRALVAGVTGRPADWPLLPQLFPTPQDEEKADAAWRELSFDPSLPVVALTLTIRQRATSVWSPERFLRALEITARTTPMQVVLCGSKDDAPLLQRVAAAAPPSLQCRVLAGRLGLVPFAMFLQRCDALLGTDSGPRHLANTVGTPVVFIRSLSVSQVEAGVYCANETDAAPPVEYLPLSRQRAALEALEPEDVVPQLMAAVARGRLRRAAMVPR